MSWRTPKGVRVLEGVEKTLFLIGASFTYDELKLEAEDEIEQGADEKIIELSSVVRALTEKTEVPELCAWNESVVGYVFDSLTTIIDTEMHLEDPSDKPIEFKNKSLMEWLLECNEQYLNNEIEIKGKDDKNRDGWEAIIDCMSERILWDEDYKLEEKIVDLKPKNAKKLKEVSGIDPDYFVQTGPAASEKNLKEAHEYLTEVTKDF